MIIYNIKFQKHVIWFIHWHLFVDMTKVKEIFIDVTYSTFKMNMHFYSIVINELEYNVSLKFILMKIHAKKDMKTQKHKKETLKCNWLFYKATKDLEIYSDFAHMNKDFCEISAMKIFSLLFDLIERSILCRATLNYLKNFIILISESLNSNFTVV